MEKKNKKICISKLRLVNEFQLNFCRFFSLSLSPFLLYINKKANIEKKETTCCALVSAHVQKCINRMQNKKRTDEECSLMWNREKKSERKKKQNKANDATAVQKVGFDTGSCKKSIIAIYDERSLFFSHIDANKRKYIVLFTALTFSNRKRLGKFIFSWIWRRSISNSTYFFLCVYLSQKFKSNAVNTFVWNESLSFPLRSRTGFAKSTVKF